MELKSDPKVLEFRKRVMIRFRNLKNRAQIQAWKKSTKKIFSVKTGIRSSFQKGGTKVHQSSQS
jgi:hypothetical protein